MGLDRVCRILVVFEVFFFFFLAAIQFDYILKRARVYCVLHFWKILRQS